MEEIRSDDPAVFECSDRGGSRWVEPIAEDAVVGDNRELGVEDTERAHEVDDFSRYRYQGEGGRVSGIADAGKVGE